MYVRTMNHDVSTYADISGCVDAHIRGSVGMHKFGTPTIIDLMHDILCHMLSVFIHSSHLEHMQCFWW